MPFKPLTFSRIILLFIVVPVCRAEFYTVRFSGSVSSFAGSGWAFPITIGEAVNAEFIIDSGVLPDDPLDPSEPVDTTRTSYTFSGRDSLHFGSFRYDSSGFGVEILNDAIVYGDGYNFQSYDYYSLEAHNTGLHRVGIGAHLSSSDLGLIESNSLPTISFDLTSFDNASYLYIAGYPNADGSGGYSYVAANITSYSIAMIPEPSSFSLVMGSIFCIIKLINRKRK